MKKFLFFLSAIAFIASGCGQKPAANTAPTATPKPSASVATAKATPKKAPAANPVPADWIRMYDDAKGYEFMVPKGTEHKSETVEGVDEWNSRFQCCCLCNQRHIHSLLCILAEEHCPACLPHRHYIAVISEN